MRGMHSLATIARMLGLFAILVQFTLPFGVAVAASVSPDVDRHAVLSCLGGPQTGDLGNAAGHYCALPGGCCIAPSVGHISSDPLGVSVTASQVDWRSGRHDLFYSVSRHAAWPRGPPSHLL